MKTLWAFFCMSAIALNTTQAETKKLLSESGPQQVQLLELYTSEGCSSCPPAERWLNALSQSKDLWTKFVPIAFHVDYWNGLGWKDPFAQQAFTQRQRNYAHAWGTRQVYTPAMILNGQEWRQWWKDRPMTKLTTPQKNPGNLQLLHKTGKTFEVHFTPASPSHKTLTAHIALLGSDRVSKVTRGENRGRTLHHHFVALKHIEKPLNAEGKYTTTFELTNITEGQALVAWVSQGTHTLQATGTSLAEKPML